MKHEARNRFLNFLSSKDLKMSRQRVIILEAFLAIGPQTNVDDLYTNLRSRHPAIGRATVYRTFKLFTESGIAKMKVVHGEPTQFEKNDFSEQEHDLQVCKAQN